VKKIRGPIVMPRWGWWTLAALTCLLAAVVLVPVGLWWWRVLAIYTQRVG